MSPVVLRWTVIGVCVRHFGAMYTLVVQLLGIPPTSLYIAGTVEFDSDLLDGSQVCEAASTNPVPCVGCW